MSFLDNLENNLKSLESQEEGQSDAARQQRDRENQRASAQAAAPYAEELKRGPYTAELLKQATRIGYGMRLKVRVAWIGSTLRLEAREKRLELRPTASGVVAAYLDRDLDHYRETRNAPLDLKGNPEELLRPWLESTVESAPESEVLPDAQPEL